MDIWGLADQVSCRGETVLVVGVFGLDGLQPPAKRGES